MSDPIERILDALAELEAELVELRQHRAPASTGTTAPRRTAKRVPDQTPDGHRPMRLLKRYRELRAMSQRQLAAETGVTFQMISAIETGRTLPSLPTAKKLAIALGITIEDLYPPFNRSDPDIEPLGPTERLLQELQKPSEEMSS
jgi:transcriptional regulator with XRE-family HTH domain